jgi:3-oxoacyl-[acyl-carrier-protein] synthase-3
VILQAVSGDGPVGILSHATRSDTFEHARLLRMDRSYKPDYGDTLFLKMDGHQLYEYVLKTTPPLVQECLDRSNIALGDIKKILVHQANAKMDKAIVRRLCKAKGVTDLDPDSVPMTVSWLGNSSVATLPTLLDLVLKGELENQELASGDSVVFVSIGAGMNVNTMVYRMP